MNLVRLDRRAAQGPHPRYAADGKGRPAVNALGPRGSAGSWRAAMVFGPRACRKTNRHLSAAGRGGCEEIESSLPNGAPASGRQRKNVTRVRVSKRRRRFTHSLGGRRSRTDGTQSRADQTHSLPAETHSIRGVPRGWGPGSPPIWWTGSLCRSVVVGATELVLDWVEVAEGRVASLKVVEVVDVRADGLLGSGPVGVGLHVDQLRS